jgi:hypothetical protein
MLLVACAVADDDPPVGGGGTQPVEQWIASPAPDGFIVPSDYWGVGPNYQVWNVHFGMQDRDTRVAPLPEIQDPDYVWDWFEFAISNGGILTITDHYGWDCYCDFQAPDYTGSWNSRVTVQATNTNMNDRDDYPDQYFSCWFHSQEEP